MPSPRVIALLLGLMLAACGGSPGGTDSADGGSGGADAGLADDDGGGSPDARGGTCGDGRVTGGETCDDGDAEADDGCSAGCTTEADFACPVPGQDCVRVVTCGNGRIEGAETCDDTNRRDGDGCAATCQREPGWRCPLAGAGCVATACGDGLVAGFEECDDGAHGAGCVDCKLVANFHCPTPGAACLPTACGDGAPQGLEDCDDGNAVVGDGCTPACLREPDCTDGVCQPVCGDEVLQAGEQCDDGNPFDGDGCGRTCQREAGFTCVEVAQDPPTSVKVFATVRDFVASCGDGARLVAGAPDAAAPFGHPDFQCFSGALTGMVADQLDGDGKPVRVANARTSSDASFAQWYRSDDTVNRTIPLEVTLGEAGAGVYRFDSASFYPTTGAGWDTVTCGDDACERLHADGNGSGDQNFHFTSELHFWFAYNGTENLAFSGDDDVWVFINGRLVVDIGGVHGRENGSVDLSDPAIADDLGLIEGPIYEGIVFQAERHTSRSQYRLTLSNFNRTPSTCTDRCGDEVTSSREVCDAGDGNGAGDGAAYGGCADDCTLEPYCGDGVVDEQFGELCDDGLNLGGEASACAPGCQSVGARCGDGVVQTPDELCDDGNATSGDGCSATCRPEID